MTNCYWIEENGAFEVCAVETEWPLTTGWIEFDSPPTPIIGRSFYDTYVGDSIAPRMVRPAYGNGLIVIGANLAYGTQPEWPVNGTGDTTGVYVSDDGGFTYSGLIEKFTWQAGTAATVGYSSVGNGWRSVLDHFGTDIYFDGSFFYVISQTMNNAGNIYPLMHVSKSADGVSWTNTISAGGNYSLTDAEAYDGDLWYLGTNDPQATNDFPYDDATILAGHSGDGGVTWTHQLFGIGNDYSSEPWPNYGDVSANQDGLHIVGLGYDVDTFVHGIFYWRPLSKNTWATPILFWEDGVDLEDMNYDHGPAVLASRINPFNVYLVAFLWGPAPDYNDFIALKRSNDGGLTFSSFEYIGELDTVGTGEHYGPTTDSSWNGPQFFELDDGRLVIVATFFDGTVPAVMYVISDDDGITWSNKIVISTDWEAEVNWRSSRVHACVRGNDVIITQTHSATRSRAYIIRP
jgi:hypothetical protein